MKFIGNLFWFIFIGLWSFIAWIFTGIILCITIIGIPFGTQCFKIATFILFPVGKNVTTNFNSHPIANMLWAIFFGWEIALSYFVVGIIFCITIIGIPFGKQCFKLMQLALLPFGSNI